MLEVNIISGLSGLEPETWSFTLILFQTSLLPLWSKCQVSVYRTNGPLVCNYTSKCYYVRKREMVQIRENETPYVPLSKIMSYQINVCTRYHTSNRWKYEEKRLSMHYKELEIPEDQSIWILWYAALSRTRRDLSVRLGISWDPILGPMYKLLPKPYFKIFRIHVVLVIASRASAFEC